MYPSIILIAMVLIGILMLTYIVPTLASTFIELKVALPLSTRIIIGVSNAIRLHGFILLGGTVIVIGLLYAWMKSAQGKKTIDFL